MRKETTMLVNSNAVLILPAVLTFSLTSLSPSAAQEKPGGPAIKLVLPAVEQALLDDVKGGIFVKQSFAEAALLASGVIEADKRKAYLDRIAGLESQAKQAIAGAKTSVEKGEKLLAWIYGPGGPIGPIGPGKQKKYAAGQTSFSVLLDTGKYNCASATLLYNVIGRRLGLDLRAIEVSDHVFSILYDGKEHADVETTTPRGFNPIRDK